MRAKIFRWFETDLSKVVDYQGRAGRQEASCFLLCETVILIVLYYLGRYWAFFSFFGLLFFALSLIPTILLFIRRLHDLNLSGWWVLLAGWPPLCFLLVCYPCHSNEANRFGFEERLEPIEQRDGGISNIDGITYFEEPVPRNSQENFSK